MCKKESIGLAWDMLDKLRSLVIFYGELFIQNAMNMDSLEWI